MPITTIISMAARDMYRRLSEPTDISFESVQHKLVSHYRL